jgi:hypothetical protein
LQLQQQLNQLGKRLRNLELRRKKFPKLKQTSFIRQSLQKEKEEKKNSNRKKGHNDHRQAKIKPTETRVVTLSTCSCGNNQF